MFDKKDMAYLVVIAIIIAFYAAVIKAIEKPKELQRLKENYERALRGTDKQVALRYGRAYYSFMRDGKTLTQYDEQAIANDLSTMKS